MKNFNSIFITRTFYPIEGGIQTYLKNIALKWKNGKVRIYCKKEKKIPDLINKPLHIQRYNFSSKSYVSALYRIFILLFNNSDLIFKKIKFFLFLVCTRSVAKNIANFTTDIVKDLKRDSYDPNIIQCSVPIYTGLVGVIIKFIFKGKLVIYIHGSELHIFNKDRNLRKLLKFVFDFADVIISNSTYTKDIAVKLGALKEKIEVVNLGANIKEFYPIDSKKEIYKKYNISQDHKLLYTISHLIPRKGNDMIIKSMNSIIKEYPNVTYLIGGKGEYKRELEKLIKENNLQSNIKFTGFIAEADLNKIMNACDIYVMPNRRVGDDVEGYGIVFMEANACKKPVIGGRSGGVVDAIIDGKTGFLVDSHSVSDISEKILDLLKDEKKNKNIGMNGFKLVINERNWDIVVSKIRNIISDL